MSPTQRIRMARKRGRAAYSRVWRYYGRRIDAVLPSVYLRQMSKLFSACSEWKRVTQ